MQQTLQAGYAGELTSAEAYDLLRRDEAAVLLDVRTPAEWSFVGRPDLAGLGRDVAFIAWQGWPDGALNPAFVDQVAAAGIAPDATVLVLCRSGQRSRNAAIALTAAGFRRCFNVSDGFEGPTDAAGQRSTLSGWKLAGLPWRQD